MQTNPLDAAAGAAAMTPEQMAKDRALCEAATPGEWYVNRIEGHTMNQIETRCPEFVARKPWGHVVATTDLGAGDLSQEKFERDAEFIAAARTRWPAALDELERLQALNEPIKSYACQECGRRDGLDAVAADHLWRTIATDHTILCLWCMDRRAADLKLQDSVSLHFSGVALHGTSDSDANRDHVRQLCAEVERLQARGAEAARELAAWRKKQPDFDRLADLLNVCEGACPLKTAINKIERLQVRVAELEKILAYNDAQRQAIKVPFAASGQPDLPKSVRVVD